MLGEIYTVLPGFGAACHAAGVGAVDYDDSAISQTYIGEKTFVSANKNAADKPIRKTHEQSYSRCANRFLTFDVC